MRTDWDRYFLNLAHAAAERGTCPRLKVGCVLVKDRNVVSTGYNGAPSGMPHCTDVGCDMVQGSCKRTLHAESNAIDRAGRHGRAGSIAYITDFPCLNCAQKIATNGIIEVVYDRDYISTKYHRICDAEENGVLTSDEADEQINKLHAWKDGVLNLFEYHCIVLRHLPALG